MRFYDVRDAEDAMMALNGRKFDGRPLRIQFARYGRVGSPSDRLGGGGGDCVIINIIMFAICRDR